MQVLAEAASREAELQAKSQPQPKPAPLRRIGAKQAAGLAASKQQQPPQQSPGSPMPRIHTLSKAQVAGLNQLTSKQAFAGQKIVSQQQQNLFNHKIQQKGGPHKALQQAAAATATTSSAAPAPASQNHLQQTFKQMQQKQQKQQKAMANANVLKSSSLPNIPNMAKLPASSNLVAAGKQQQQQQPQQQTSAPQQIQRSQSAVIGRAQQLINAKSQQVIAKPQSATPATAAVAVATKSQQQLAKAQQHIAKLQQQQLSSAKLQQQQQVLLKIAAQNKSSTSGNAKNTPSKATSTATKAANQQPQQTVIQQTVQRNQIMAQNLAMAQQQQQQQPQPIQTQIQHQHVVVGPQNTPKQPGCIKTIAPQKPSQKNHAAKNASIKTSLNTNLSTMKTNANLATTAPVNAPMTSSTQQKSGVKTILPQQPGGNAGASAATSIHKVAGQPLKIQPQPVKQQKQIIVTTPVAQYNTTIRPQPGQIKTLMSVNVADSRKDNELKIEIKTELKQENEVITPTLASSSQIPQSPQRRLPLPYECLQFVLQDHNYGAPPPRTPPPLSPPPHPKQQPVNGAGNSCITTQHSYIFNQELGDSLCIPAVSKTTVEDDAGSAISSEAGREVEPEGEETETAPEGEGDDEDSVTRCICDFEHDDGYMICCDRCLVWQHVDCMGIDRANIPDEYLCEVCRPRRVDRARARALQMRKREELLNSDTTSDSSSTSSADTDVAHNTPAKNRKASQQQQQTALRRKSDPPPQVRRLNNNNNNNNNNVAKRQRRDTHPRQTSTARTKKESTVTTMTATTAATTTTTTTTAMATATTTTQATQATKQQRGGGPGKRKTKRRTSLEDKEDETLDSWGSNMAPLRQWIERYEEAVTNHYSPELRARISSIKVNGTHNDLRQSNIGTAATGKCRLNVQSNSLRFLVATMYLPPNTPVVELRGKYMLSTQHRPSHPQGRQHTQRPGPFVFFYRLPRDGTEVCVDTRTYGNDARFVRRSCKPNAEVKHCIEKGTLHLYIVTNVAIEKNAEITIKHDQHDLMLSPNSNNSGIPIMCACNNPKDCQIASLIPMSTPTNKKGNNGPLAENADGRERRRRGRRNTVSEDANDSSTSATTSSSTNPTTTHTTTVVAAATLTQVAPKKTVTINTNVTVKEIGSAGSSIISSISNNDKNTGSSSSPITARQAVREEQPQSAEVVAAASSSSSQATAVAATVSTPPSQPSSTTPSQTSSSRSIPTAHVPSTTTQIINTEPKKDKKKMTREERKMEAIMKAFERLEKAEQRKQEVQARNAQRKESGGAHSDNDDGAAHSTSKSRQRDQHQSSDKGPRRKRRKGRTRSTSGSQSHGTRRTRLNSAESDLTSGDESNSMQSPPPLASQNCSYSLRVHGGKESNNGMAVNSAGSQTGIPSAAGLLLALANSNTLGSNSPPQQHQPQQPTPVKSPSGDSGASSSSQSSTPSTPLSSACLLVAAAVGPLAPGFKFPKTKKLLMNEWLKEAPEPQGQNSEARAGSEFAEHSSAEFLSQNYAAKGLATLVQAAHSVAGICDSPPQRATARQAAATPTPILSTGSAKKRWLRQAISEECDSPNSSSRPDSPPSEMLAPPKKRRIARESLSSDNYTPPTTPTMMQQEHGPTHRPSINEDDFVEHMPSPSTEDLGSQNEYDSDQIKDDIKLKYSMMDEVDGKCKTNSPISLNSVVIKEEVQCPLALKIKEESKSDDEDSSINNTRRSLKPENDIVKVKCESESSVPIPIKNEPRNTGTDQSKVEYKTIKFEEVIEKGTVEIVDQNEQDIETDELSSPIATMESDAELKKRVAELRLEFGGGIAVLTNICNEANKSFEDQPHLVHVKHEENNDMIDELDVEAQMKQITGDDGDDYKEKVDINLERDKSMDGIEGLMESSKEDSESEPENRDMEDFRDCDQLFEKFNEKRENPEDSEKRVFKEFECKNRISSVKGEFDRIEQQTSSTKTGKLEILTESTHLKSVELLDSISKHIGNFDNGATLKEIDQSHDSEAKKQEYKSTAMIPTPEESMMELDSMELPSEGILEEPAKIFPSIPPLSERIRKKVDTNPAPKSKLEIEASIIESSLDMEVVNDAQDVQEKKILSTALRELLEAKIEPETEPTPEPVNKNVIENRVNATLETNPVEQALIEETVDVCLVVTLPPPVANDQINRNIVDPTVMKLDPPPPEPVKDPRLKDPRTVVPNKITSLASAKAEGPPPIKRKLSISEYRKRKQQSTGTPPEPENADTLVTEGKSASRGRSDSASSGTSSLSSDDESATKAPLDIPSLSTLPMFANTEGDEKKDFFKLDQ
ncbi:uncharacterized protein LOC100114564 isoform X3 [Nasonia vitripennis]|uniref:SET domain-containing protein n=1 Tax=Nasonia vitripennis TaxID=7425 RepID=A0A7M7T6Q2_NASVI|nr:uncharacterized protein LOC100114564 isoform X3 [Nasonia vitripennis]